MGKVCNVILSGGVGSRLWPLSRKSRPKQYLSLFEGQTLFQKTLQRNAALCQEALVIGNVDNYKLSRKDLEGLGITVYKELVEACPRNTAAAIAFAAFHMKNEDILFVTPSDHLIEEGEAYTESVKQAILLAKAGNIVTFGIAPTKPDTGFGYIEYEGDDVLSFREKPDELTAKAFIEQGNFLWNSGMFCFQAGVFLEELMTYESEIYKAALLAYEQRNSCYLPLDQSMQIPSMSVDYAVMERSQKIKVVPSSFIWSDMGSFESIYDYLQAHGHQPDEAGNMVIGGEVHTEFAGLTNTILIQTVDAILVLQKEKAQEVKDVYKRLEKEKPELV